MTKLPPNYNGIFAVRFQTSDDEDLENVIQLPTNGVATIQISKKRALGLSRSSFSAETQDGRTFQFNGMLKTNAQNYEVFVFCIDQSGSSIRACEIPIEFETSMIDQAIKEGIALSKIVSSAKVK
jgi:hypothetical protein